ncbi:MAG: UGSC family (seleno)protein, partial [Bilophila wadsworthia]
MGRVLIALCTVFLLAFPARGEQAVTWESLTVWNDLPPLYDPAPWPSDLTGKRVILRWNGKHNGDLLLDYLHSLLSRAFPDTEFIKAYETDPTLSGISKDLHESEATARALLELRPDLVIAATGDCRACSAWLAIDQIQLERAGVPTLTILTQPFLKTFHNVRQNLRIGPLHCVAVPH